MRSSLPLNAKFAARLLLGSTGRCPIEVSGATVSTTHE